MRAVLYVAIFVVGMVAMLALLATLNGCGGATGGGEPTTELPACAYHVPVDCDAGELPDVGPVNQEAAADAVYERIPGDAGETPDAPPEAARDAACERLPGCDFKCFQGDPFAQSCPLLTAKCLPLGDDAGACSGAWCCP